jgi:hypothetical protein
MAKLDLRLEKAGTCATNPSHYWLADLSLIKSVNQRVLVSPSQLSQNNYHFDLRTKKFILLQIPGNATR